MTALRATALALSLAILTASSALAAPPLATDDAGTVAVGSFEVEINGFYATDKHHAGVTTCNASASSTEIKFSTGLFKDISGSLVLPYTFSLRETEDGEMAHKSQGLGDLTLEIKYGFAELAGINLAIKPSLVAPTGRYSQGLSEGHWHGSITMIASKEFADGAYALHANVGYEHHRYRTHTLRSTTHGNLWTGSIAGEAELLKGLVLVADVGIGSNPIRGDHEPPIYALTGARFEINELLDINAGIKFGLTEPETDITALYGLMLKF